MFVRLYKLFRNEKLPELIGIILLSFLYTIFSVYEFFRYFIYLIKLRKLYNIHSGKRCFIIGNGPSLKSEDLDKLRDEISFASNGIYLIFPYTKWRPTYFTISDIMYLDHHRFEIDDIPSKKIINVYGRNLLRNMKQNVFYFREIYFSYIRDKKRGFSFLPYWGVYGGGTVVFVQIQIAIFMGFKEIHLLGVDFEYKHKDQKKEVFLKSDEDNHFNKDYLKVGKDYNTPNLDEHYRSFIKAKKICDKLGVKIYNASRKTKLDVFPKVDFDLLFN